MSTKVYGGHLLRPGVDLFGFLRSLRLVLDPVRDREDADILVKGAVKIIDDATLSGSASEIDSRGIIYSAYRNFIDEQDEIRPNLVGNDPNRFEMSVGFDDLTQTHFILVYVDNMVLRDAFRSMSEVREYAYWNSSDRPDHVTAEEWLARRDFWDRALGFDPIYKHTYSWSLRRDQGGMRRILSQFRAEQAVEGPGLKMSVERPMTEMFGSLIPSIADRAETIATRLMVNSLDGGDRADVVDQALHIIYSRDYGEVISAVADRLDPISAEDLDALNPESGARLIASRDELAALAARVSKRILTKGASS